MLKIWMFPPSSILRHTTSYSLVSKNPSCSSPFIITQASYQLYVCHLQSNCKCHQGVSNEGWFKQMKEASHFNAWELWYMYLWYWLLGVILCCTKPCQGKGAIYRVLLHQRALSTVILHCKYLALHSNLQISTKIVPMNTHYHVASCNHLSNQVPNNIYSKHLLLSLQLLIHNNQQYLKKTWVEYEHVNTIVNAWWLCCIDF